MGGQMPPMPSCGATTIYKIRVKISINNKSVKIKRKITKKKAENSLESGENAQYGLKIREKLKFWIKKNKEY